MSAGRRHPNRTADRRAAVTAAALALTMSVAVPPAFGQGGATTEELVEALRDGGHVIFVRHAPTERDYADQVGATMDDCSSQRTLSEAGWKEAQAIGDAFDRLGIPVGNVTSSQYCRAWQTADLAFGRYVKTPDLNFEPAEEYTDEQFAAMRDRVVPYLIQVSAGGVNTVLVGHDDPFEVAMGIYPGPMGVTFVIASDGDGGFELLGRIGPDGWPD